MDNSAFNETCILNGPSMNEYFKVVKAIYSNDPLELYQRVHKFYYASPTKSDEYKIPLISHHIWLTNLSNPKEARKDDVENLKHTISVLDQDNDAWEHIFWTNCKACIPETLKELEELNIEIKNIHEIKEQLISYDVVTRFIYDSKFGMAADLLRMDLVNNFGGYYSDLNYITNNSPAELMKQFNFIVSLSDSYFFVENYMFASSPSHPILISGIKTILTVMEDLDFIYNIYYSPNCSDSTITDQVTYSNGFVLPFVMNANVHGTDDLVIHTNPVNKAHDLYDHRDYIKSVTGPIPINEITELNAKENTKYTYFDCPIQLSKATTNYQHNTIEIEEELVQLHGKFNANFDDHLYCSVYNIGEDGRNGRTWLGDKKLSTEAYDAGSIENEASLLTTVE